jgi:aspartate aminotransferase-like enzyme
MSESLRSSEKHIKLFIPGPTEVRAEILDAQTRWMVGHRMPEAADLFASIQEKLRQVFLTEKRVYVTASSGTGWQEGSVRNLVSRKVLACVNGAFADRWREVAAANGKACEVLEAPWGEPILPEVVVERLAGGDFDAVTIVHNETSTGVTSPIRDIASAIRALPGGEEIMILVDSVSGLSGAEVRTDEWDLDMVFTSSQKAFSCRQGWPSPPSPIGRWPKPSRWRTAATTSTSCSWRNICCATRRLPRRPSA